METQAVEQWNNSHEIWLAIQCAKTIKSYAHRDLGASQLLDSL